MRTSTARSLIVALGLVALATAAPAAAQGMRLQSSDLSRLRSVGEVAMSPDGTHIAYTVMNDDRPGRPYPELYVMTVQTGVSARLTAGDAPSSDAVWSPDSQWIAYHGEAGGHSGLVVAHPDGTGTTFL
ncbi:MAG TPA: hypothetical protein VND92_00545, partial [Vicinamibacterales bacterium]|nr:hypothetical protein [Vicinamibacterales bacterium]